MRQVTKKKAKRATSHHMVKMMLGKEHHSRGVNETMRNVARD